MPPRPCSYGDFGRSRFGWESGLVFEEAEPLRNNVYVELEGKPFEHPAGPVAASVIEWRYVERSVAGAGLLGLGTAAAGDSPSPVTMPTSKKASGSPLNTGSTLPARVVAYRGLGAHISRRAPVNWVMLSCTSDRRRRRRRVTAARPHSSSSAS